MNERIAQIRERLNKAKQETKTFVVEDRSENMGDCPVCENCPMCGGENEVEMTTWDYKNMAAGIQVFGIGEDMKYLENFVNNAADDIEYLLSQIETTN